MQSSFDFTAKYHQGDKFSTAAHDSVKETKHLLRTKVVAYVHNRGLEGATSDEIEKALDHSHQGISARLTEAVWLQELVKTNRSRKTRSGRNARVLIYKGLIA